MAKLKVKQIEDLSLANGVITIGKKADGGLNTIIPLTDVEVSGTGDYISGASVSGNIVTLTKAALPGITVTAEQNLPEGAVPFVRDITASGHTITKKMGAIGNGLAIDTNGVLNLNLAVNPGAGSTGQVISGLSYANGVLAPTYSTVAAADVTVATGITGLSATNVQGALAELQGDIAALQTIDPIVTTVTEGTGIKVTDNGTGNDHAYTVQANFKVDTKKYGEDAGDKAGKTYIRIMDGETLISETDAAAFVKDGFLQKVELIEASEGQENVLRFTWNSDAGIQVTNIPVSDLCDVYTADETYLHLNGFKFEHNTSGVTAGEYAANATNVTVDNTTSQSFKVPTLTVNAAGHVTAASEKTVTISLPASIDTAVQTVTSTEAVNATDKFVAVQATRAEDSNDVVLTSELKTQEIATAAADANGLATALDVKTYVANNASTLMCREELDYNTATLTYTPVGAVAITQNGLDLDENEYSVNGKSVTFSLEVEHEEGDTYVAYYMYNPNTQTPQA